jgi:hypothetical protein
MTHTEKMSAGITTNLFDEFGEFNAFDVTVEPDEEKRDTYSCEVWAYSEDNVINDISVTAKGADSGELTNSVILELYRKMAMYRRAA